MAKKKFIKPTCNFCGRKGHDSDQCWDNPKGKNYRGNKNSKKNHNPRLAVARVTESLSSAFVKDARCTMARATVSHGNGTMSTEGCHDQNKKFVIDSGATHHMCSGAKLFLCVRNTAPFNVTLGDNSVVQGNKAGEVDILLSISKGSESKGVWIRLTNVLLLEEVGLNLLSLNDLDTHNINVTFKNGGCILIGGDDSNVIVTGYKRSDGLYQIDGSIVQDPNCRNLAAVSSNESSGLSLWHRRFGHTNKETLNKLSNNGLINGINLQDTPEQIVCHPCLDGKQTRQQFKGVPIPKNCKPGDIIFSDVCGPFHCASWNKAKYFVTFIDAATNHVNVVTIRTKDEVTDAVKVYWINMEKHFKATVRRLHSDNGGEYVNNEMNILCRQQGIIHTTTASYNPQSNGVAERMNRTIMEKTRALLSEASLEFRFWAEAAHHAVYLQNLLPAGNRTLSPTELLTGKKPNVQHLRIFGCLFQAFVPEKNRRKLDPKTKGLIHIGHVTKTVSRGFNPLTLKVQLVRHGVFDETVFRGTNTKKEGSEVDLHTDDRLHQHSEGEVLNMKSEDEFESSSGEDAVLVLTSDENKSASGVPIWNRSISPPVDFAPRRSSRVNRRPPSRYRLLAKASDDDMPSVNQAMSGPDAHL